MRVSMIAASAALVLASSIPAMARPASEPMPRDDRFAVSTNERSYESLRQPTFKRRHFHVRRSHLRGMSKAYRRLYHYAVAHQRHGGLTTVATAAGISITVAPEHAGQFTGFIADLVSSGYTPRQIHCFASGGHVRHSNHYRGAACDIDQRGWGRTASRMYHIGALARKHGLRDGCSFGDCGHVDVPPVGRIYARYHRKRVASLH